MKTKNSRKLPSIRELFHKIAVFFHGLWRSMGLQELKRLRWQNFLLLIGAGCINAVGVTMFLAPVNLYDSGISGTSMLLWQATPPQYTLSLFLVVLNVPLFLFGLKKQGWCFTVYSIWAVLVYSAASYVITNILPVDVSVASPFAGQDLLLCAIFGGLVSGAGSGFTIRLGGAIDGMEVLGVTFAKGLGLTVGSFVMIYNVILYLFIGVFFNSWILPLYSIITYFVGNKTVDFIVEGLDKAKSVMIVTMREEEICQALSEEFGRGITQISARGYFSGVDKCVIYFVVNRFQIPKVKQLVTAIDPGAFITVTEISDVMGTSVKQK
ncbi:MAG: YitT family protein [Candidatus Faecousia sp.]|nr:YitT family protein [Candidatus Faecousia sp.]